MVGDLRLNFVVDNFFDVCVEDTVDFSHSLYFYGHHSVVFLYFECVFHTVFQVVNLIDVAKAALINLLEDLESFLYNGTNEGVVTVPFAVDT